MANSRIHLSVIALLSGFMLIYMLVSLAGLGPTDVATVGSSKFIYFVCIIVLYVYFWIFFYRRHRGSRTLLDGRAALSGSAFILGGAIGYVCIDLGIIASLHNSEFATGSFAIFVGYTVLPIVAWIIFYIATLRRKNAALRAAAKS